MASDTLYDRLGGHEGIRAVVDEFYDRLEADEELGPLFEDADMERLRETQTDFLCEAAGGQRRTTQRPSERPTSTSPSPQSVFNEPWTCCTRA
ncbi:truncated hemoglobin [Halobaculum halobium]|uniref:truncated hemoglobin n=1 Tax=Halobaculum halobium TaxID=3032281 RepID=UPI003613287B